MKWLYAVIALFVSLICGPAVYAQPCIAQITYDTFHTEEHSALILPRVSLPNKQAEAAINESLSVESLTGYTFEEVLEINKKIEADRENGYTSEEWIDDGYNSISAEIKKNSDCVLSIHLYITRIAATVSAIRGTYPLDHKLVSYDLSTGQRIEIDSLIRKDKMPELLQLADKTLMKNFRKGEKTFGRVAAHAYRSLNVEPEFTEETIRDFYIGDDGLYFYFDFYFFNCDKQWEPEGTVFIPKKKLRGLLVKQQYGL